MPKSMCGRWLARSLDLATQRERPGPHTPARYWKKARLPPSTPRSLRCHPLRRNQDKLAVSQNALWTTLPSTPSACAIPSSVPKGCILVVASLRLPAKPLSALVPNALGCAGRLKASMLSCLCAPPFSTAPTTRSGSKNMLPDCLQRIHTPVHDGLCWLLEASAEKMEV